MGLQRLGKQHRFGNGLFEDPALCPYLAVVHGPHRFCDDRRGVRDLEIAPDARLDVGNGVLIVGDSFRTVMTREEGDFACKE